MHASQSHYGFLYLDSGLKGFFWIVVKEWIVFLNTVKFVKFVRLMACNMNEAGWFFVAAHHGMSGRRII